MTIGEKIRSAREQAGLSRKQLADKSGLSVKSIINWELNVLVPKSVDTILALAQALGVAGIDLLEDYDRDLMLGKKDIWGDEK